MDSKWKPFLIVAHYKYKLSPVQSHLISPEANKNLNCIILIIFTSQTGCINNNNSKVCSRKPLYTFDVGAPVGDVSWAPYSSTTFAVATDDGKVIFCFTGNMQ